MDGFVLRAKVSCDHLPPRFADIPSVRAALKEMLTHPFRDPAHAVTILQRSFGDVLPASGSPRSAPC